MILKRMTIQFGVISKMKEINSIEAIEKTNLTHQMNFRLNEIIGIENSFHEKINPRKLCS